MKNFACSILMSVFNLSASNIYAETYTSAGLDFTENNGYPMTETILQENEIVSDENDEEDKFTFGEVVSVDGDSIVLREYDFTADADVETVYVVTPETEYGNINDLRDLSSGDDVVIDFLTEGDGRVITTIVREEVSEMQESDLEETAIQEQIRSNESYSDDEATIIVQENEISSDGNDEEGKFTFGKVVSVEGDSIVLREYDFAADVYIENVYSVTPETEYENINDLRDISPGDDIVIDIGEEGDGNVITAIARLEIPEMADSNQEEIIIPELVRSEAFELYKSGDYAQASELLNKLLDAEFDVLSTRMHLARIALVTDDLLTARKHTAYVWEHRAEAAPYVVARALWFQTAFALLDGSSPTKFLGQLKTVLQSEDAYMEWAMDPVLAHLESKLPASQRALLIALLAAISDSNNLTALDAFPAWREASPQPLEWPMSRVWKTITIFISSTFRDMYVDPFDLLFVFASGLLGCRRKYFSGEDLARNFKR
jgi:hypothetical protein